MKSAIIAGVMVATIVMAGCGKKNSSSGSSTAPNTTTQEKSQEWLVIKIGPSNALSVLGEKCPQSELVTRLTKLVGQNYTKVVIRGANVDDNQVKLVADACKKAGVNKTNISYGLIRY